MGIYIKGVKKPDRCEACYCSTHDNRYFDIICDLLHRTVAINDCDYKEPTIPPKDCPLVEVKEPHGRLVDLDVLEKERNSIDCGYNALAALEWDDECILNAPTIIEAENEESEDICDNCGYEIPHLEKTVGDVVLMDSKNWKYCPNCGKRRRSE